MKDSTVPGVYLLNIDMECGQAKEEFKRMGFTDGEKIDFQRFTPQALSVTPLWLVWHGTVHSGNVLLKSDEELPDKYAHRKHPSPNPSLYDVPADHPR